jgi:putative ABC transport system substrate-binding protein
MRRAPAWLVLVALAMLPSLAAAQPAGRPLRVGVLDIIPPSFDPGSRPIHRAIVEGLQQHGWTVGRNAVIEYRSSAGKPDRLPAAAVELVALKPDVILSIATGSAIALRDATNVIPVVMVGTGDPVVMGIIESLSRPGHNVTGLAVNAGDLAAKRVQLLKEAVPGLSKVAVLWNSSIKSMTHGFQQIEIAAPSLGVTLLSVRASGPHEFDQSFAAIAQGRPQGLVVLFGPITGTDLPRIVEFITKAKLPTIFEALTGVESGGLMALGVDFADLARRACTYVDKIARGAKASELPVEEPNKFDLVINLRTAKTLGLTMPPTLLLRADRIIE